jgi:hypothetical protein
MQIVLKKFLLQLFLLKDSVILTFHPSQVSNLQSIFFPKNSLILTKKNNNNIYIYIYFYEILIFNLINILSFLQTFNYKFE